MEQIKQKARPHQVPLPSYEKAAVELAREFLRELAEMFEAVPVFGDDRQERDMAFNARRCWSALGSLSRLRGLV